MYDRENSVAEDALNANDLLFCEMVQGLCLTKRLWLWCKDICKEDLRTRGAPVSEGSWERSTVQGIFIQHEKHLCSNLLPGDNGKEGAAYDGWKPASKRSWLKFWKWVVIWKSQQITFIKLVRVSSYCITQCTNVWSRKKNFLQQSCWICLSKIWFFWDCHDCVHYKTP